MFCFLFFTLVFQYFIVANYSCLATALICGKLKCHKNAVSIKVWSIYVVFNKAAQTLNAIYLRGVQHLTF